MDDGGKLDYNKNSKNLSVVLNTHTKVETMAIELSHKFKLNCSTRSNKGKSVIVIDSSSFNTLKRLIKPYLIPEMEYKLPKLPE